MNDLLLGLQTLFQTDKTLQARTKEYNYMLQFDLSKEMDAILETKEKEKARKELWDSLCEIYETEAVEENLDLDISVDDLEEWSVNNPNTSKRALQLADTDPQPSTAASLQDHADSFLGLKIENDQKMKRVKRREINKEDTGPPNEFKSKLSCIKSTKRLPSPKNFKKPRSKCQKENLYVSLLRSIKEKKSKGLIEPQKPTTNNLGSGKKRNEKQTCKKKTNKVPKSSNMQEVKLKGEKKKCPSCRRNLEYRYYLNTQHANTRSDGRIFNCKLIFKLCYCTYSDVEL